MKLLNRSCAFTLIELLLVISIITIVTGASIPTFSNYLKNQIIKNAVDQFRNDLRTIQNKSLTGSMSDSLVYGGPLVSPGGSVKYWAIKWWNGTGRYRYYAIYDYKKNPPAVTASDMCTSFTDSNNPSNDTRLQGYLSLPSGITFTTTGCLFFKISDGAVYADNDAVSGYIEMTDSSSTLRTNWNYAGWIGD